MFMPIVTPCTPAVGTEQGDTVHVQFQTQQEGKCTNLDPKTKKTDQNQNLNPPNNP